MPKAKPTEPVETEADSSPDHVDGAPTAHHSCQPDHAEIQRQIAELQAELRGEEKIVREIEAHDISPERAHKLGPFGVVLAMLVLMGGSISAWLAIQILKARTGTK